MTRSYASAAQGMPSQALAIKLCELAGVDLAHITDVVDIHCTMKEYPVVTFSYVLSAAQCLELTGYKSE